MPIINFKNIGRLKRSWTEVMPYPHLDKIAKAAKEKGALMSKDIQATYDENADLNERCEGTIFAGFRPVGRFEVMKKAGG
jgi:hypothetical protein